MKKLLLTLIVFNLLTTVLFAQTKTITGIVFEANGGEPLPGVNLIYKGSASETKVGTITQSDGEFQIVVPADAKTLVFSFIGMKTKEVPIGNNTRLLIYLEEESIQISDVVIVGYGIQKKESVVGAITQVNGDELKKSGGVTNIGQALQGKLPGVTTTYTNGTPGSEDMKIFIRGQSSWNNAGSPLVLVDGIERSMNNVDMNEIESISVLKDASATAVYGVKGANGVILLTTKRGQVGKAQFSVSAENTLKTVSKLPEKLESYDAIMTSNKAIERELMYSESSWADYTPVSIAEKYRNQTSQHEQEVYPNVNWKDYMMNDYANDYKLNLSVRGGNKSATYFCNFSFLQENDLFKSFDNGKGYQGEYNFKRFNYRSNLDFNITRTTKLSINLSGSNGIQKRPNFKDEYFYLGLYYLSSDIYYPKYEDGSYGFYEASEWVFTNPLYSYSSSGFVTKNTFRLNSDFILNQDLNFITKGLSLQGKFSFDNSLTGEQTVTDLNNGKPNLVFKRYVNEGQDVVYEYPATNNDYRFVVTPWILGENYLTSSRIRRMNYQLSLNYARRFGNHNLSGLFLFKREEYASGSMFPIYYEDWVGRATYDYDGRYLLEINGAYNGSEKFGPGYRFDLFPSFAAGWLVSNEKFMQGLNWLDKLKLRGSYGMVGDDGFTGRWQYITQWASLGTGAAINNPGYYSGSDAANATSPYKFYTESVIGNKDLHWETSIKKDFGLELALFKNEISLEFDYFTENRKDILIYGSNRSIPDWFGNEPPDANLGEVEVKGYELVIGLNHNFTRNFKAWTNFSYTQANDKVINAEDPELAPEYQKMAGYPIGQMKSAIAGDIMKSLDDIYMSTPLTSGDDYKRIGYYDLVDFDGNGIYDANYDNAPYGYPTRPQNTWSWTIGASYKNWSLSCQFYGMYNSTRQYTLASFPGKTHLFFEENTDYWTKDNQDATKTLPAWSVMQGNTSPYSQLYDASMVRLKMIDISYSFSKKACKKMGISDLKVYLNGNNLLLWTDMADDRDFNNSSLANTYGDYPTMKRFNLGFNLDF